jgi:ligand-binding sensor domain-containing protein/serine phosphatase RsbU (regulator of sigma subunit)
MLFILCFPFYQLQSQTYYFDSYSTSEGAPSKVYCVYQDRNRNIWLGTPSGVALFDGKVFQNFTSAQGLAPLAVRCIFEDEDKNLWMGHAGGGISVFRDNKFEVFDSLRDYIRGNITSLFSDAEKNLWITTEASGAFRLNSPFNPEKYSFEHYLGNRNLSDRVYNYCLTHDKSLYLITDVGVREFNSGSNEFELFQPRGLSYYFNVITMYEDRDFNLWFGTYNGGLYKYMPLKDTIRVYDIKDGLSSNWISGIQQDNHGNMWIGTWGGGLNQLNNEGITVFNAENGLEAEYIFSLIEDEESNVIIGSSNKGLFIFKGEVFVNYGSNEGLYNTEVNAFLIDIFGKMWVGTNKGLFIYDKTFSKLLNHYSRERYMKGDSDFFISGKVSFLKQDSNENIWIGTQEQRVLFYDSKSEKFYSALDVNKWFRNADYVVTAMEVDNLNVLWAGTYDGLIRYDIQSGESIRISNADGLIGNDITTLYSDSLNHLWVGAHIAKGISKITSDTIESYEFAHPVTPTCMQKDLQGMLWIGTLGQGLLVFDGDTIVRQFTQTDGLMSNTIQTLNLDSERNNMYVGTNKGINIVDPTTERIISYGASNGFIGETNLAASYIDNMGRLWYGTSRGINMFDPEKQPIILPEPLVYFTELKVNQASRSFSASTKYKFRENHITISYNSICLTNPDAVRYRIMLEGLDDNWLEITTNTSVTYQALPPGRYGFKVVARNAHGEWNSNPLTFNFQILPPFYVRWYFILTVVIFVLLGFRFYIKIRERNLIREKRILEAKVEQRTVQLSVANAELATKNKDITDSIRYAQRIQQAILPPVLPFNNTFLLFKPKDIVSGDFYWVATLGTKELIAAVDCTGHGVPGAFISFVGYSSLNKVVKEKGITQPGLVLDKMNESVINALNLRSKEAIRDGMDLAFISFDKEQMLLEYAGAYNPLYLVRNKELIETKADRFPIGKSSEDEKSFTNHSIPVQKGDMIYIFSDGYADQFGGEEQKKFKTGQFKRLLVSIAGKSIDEQQSILDTTIEEWRGAYEQIDDILVIGRKF